ncbi:AN1-type zinc finger protein 2A [Gracilariopsis chorda]|uniref:AN1-type zinc finger protein 2A n=1 Tax=Gracilariopsis chorda TaxID=448386 RepID=A0A2V3IQF0_9FLOR|nr:AN1-type zinc finger protein 2A [Gracilariopsis chorda]|eukprot:PXF43370.1 AN1-type zinc finger protein 2A [Gracilariopsis chorda]
MEVDGLGARCALPSCRTLDYLPFTCNSCSLKYCQAHAQPTDHACAKPSERDVPTCPLCSAPVPIPPGSTRDAAVSRHIDMGCPRRARANPRCMKLGCNTRDPVATTCPSCGNVFCLAHRIESQHDCTATRRTSNRQQKSSARSSSHTTKRSLSLRKRRVQFVNTPSSPIGDSSIPPENQLTVAVFFPAATEIKPRFMVFSKRNTPGRIIDELKRQVKDLPQPQGDRYYLYGYKAGGNGVNLLPYITPIKDMPHLVQSGDCLILENGDSGLDQAWITALQKLGKGQRASKSSRSADNCAVA